MRTVIGVMPPKFAFPIRESLWTPLSIDPLASRGARDPIYQVIARLKPGVSVAQGQGAGRRPSPRSSNGVPGDEPRRRRRRDALREDRARSGDLRPALHDARRRHRRAADRVRQRVEPAGRRARRCGGARWRCAWRSAPARSRVVRQHLTEVARARDRRRRHSASCSASSACAGSPQALSVNPPPFWITFELDYRVHALRAAASSCWRALFAGTLPALHAARVSAGAALKDDSRSSDEREPRPIQQRPRRRGAGRVVRPADCRRPDDQERRAAEERADAVRDRERADRARRSAARPLSGLGRRASASSSSCCPGCRRCRASRRRRCRTACRRPATARSPVQIEGKAYPHDSDSPLAREGIVTAGLLRHVPDAASLSGREFTPADAAASQPVAIVNESFARTHFPERGCRRPPDEARSGPASQEPWLTDRRRRAGSAHGRHRQQQREPDRLLHSDRAERRRQRRAHRGAHARRARRRDVARALAR